MFAEGSGDMAADVTSQVQELSGGDHGGPSVGDLRGWLSEGAPSRPRCGSPSRYRPLVY